MTFSRDAAVAALKPLLGGTTVPDGFRLVDVRSEGSDLVVLFRWRSNRHVFGIVFPWRAAVGVSTGQPVASAGEWATEVSWWLAEELDTGYVGRAWRRQKPDYIELYDRGYEFDDRYYVSQVPGNGAWLAHCGWDVSIARGLRRRGLLVAWLQAYLNNASGDPVVGQAVVGRLATGEAELAVLDVTSGVPDVVARDLVWVAVHEADDDGAARIKVPGGHTWLLAELGFAPVGDDAAWRHTSASDIDT